MYCRRAVHSEYSSIDPIKAADLYVQRADEDDCVEDEPGF